jgi:acetyl-CoA acetyltransferase
VAALLAGLPVTVPGVTLNRLCASGMDAAGTAARAIKLGEIGLAIAGGVESTRRAKCSNGRLALATMCDGVGQGVALAVERL